jgi:TPR repeat protein
MAGVIRQLPHRVRLFVAAAAIFLVVLAASAQTLSVEEMIAKADAAFAAKDFPEALRWNLKAAELGNARAQNNLGAMFQDGVGVYRNYNEALKWYLMAASGGNVQAQKNLGDLYEDIGVPSMCRDPESKKVSLGCFWVRNLDDPNDVEAVKWYLRAAEKGHPGAMTNLARMFALGYGAKKNCAAARRWFNKAASAGNEAAADNLRSGVGGACQW